MNQLIVQTTQLPTYSIASDKASFLAYLKATGRRETTIQTYDMALRSIYRTMAEEGAVLDPRFITPDDIVHLRQVMTVCDSSKKLYLIVLGRFCKYLTGKNPREDAELLWNDDDKRRKFISPEQYHLLKASADPEQGLMLALGANMGLRRCEIAGCPTSTTVTSSSTARVTGPRARSQGCSCRPRCRTPCAGTCP